MGTYNRPDAKQADASWVGRGAYDRPDAKQADATWQAAAANTGELLAQTQPPVPPIAGGAFAVDYITTGTLQATAPLLAVVPPIVFSAEAEQRLDLPAETTGPRAQSAQGHASRDAAGSRMESSQKLPGNRAAIALQASASAIQRQNAIRAGSQERAGRRSDLWHDQGARAGRTTAGLHAEKLRISRQDRNVHAHGHRRSTTTAAPIAEALRGRQWIGARHAKARPQTRPLAARGSRHGRQEGTGHQHPWAHGIRPLPGRWWPFYEPPPLGQPVVLVCPYTPRPLHCPVLLHWYHIEQPFCAGFDPEPPSEQVVIPILTRYVVINDFSLVRADTGQPIEAQAFSASLDVDSWTWGWSARVHGDYLDTLRGSPGEYVELIATINGTPLRVAVERLGRDRRFADSWLTISGRGRAAELADPYAPKLTFAAAQQLTAQQLLEGSLTDNGVPIGWAVDWQAVNWSVPAGAWSLTGTYMDAALRIAEAAGAYVQGHDTDKTLHILPRYPSLPWQWATADLVLPEDVCTIEGIEWVDRPAYNAVWISGSRRDRIRRAGSAADRYAPSIVDPLATHEDMTRARGSAILADTGRQAHISVRLPVLPETGIIKPGRLIQYTERGNTHLGLSRAVSLEHRFPEIWQTIRIETHEDTA